MKIHFAICISVLILVASISAQNIKCLDKPGVKCGDCREYYITIRRYYPTTSEDDYYEAPVVYCTDCGSDKTTTDKPTNIYSTTSDFDLSDQCKSKSTISIILGIVIPLLCCVGICVAIYFCCCRKKNTQEQVMAPSQSMAMSGPHAMGGVQQIGVVTPVYQQSGYGGQPSSYPGQYQGHPAQGGVPGFTTINAGPTPSPYQPMRAQPPMSFGSGNRAPDGNALPPGFMANQRGGDIAKM